MKKNRNRVFTLAVLFSAAALILHMINKIITLTASFKEMLNTAEKKFYEWRFGRIYYTKQGSGSPILLVHDALPGSSGYEWKKIEDRLAADHTVYTIDLLGCGRSEKPGITYTNFLYVQMLCDFIKNIIKEKTDIVASGFSSSFVIMAHRNDKQYFGKMILVNPPNPAAMNQIPSKKDKIFKTLLEIPVFGTFVYHIIVSRENIREAFIEKYFYNPFHLDEDLLDAYYEAAHKGGPFAKYMYACKVSKFININICQGMKDINGSIYIIEGDSEINAKKTLDNYQKLNASIETAVIKKSKHFPHVENPESFLKQVYAYL